MAEKKYSIDIEGSDLMSRVLLQLLNTFPGITDGNSIKFSTLNKDKGIGFYPTSGAAILDKEEDICGHVKMTCLYPFTIIYRASPSSEQQRLRIKEWLDLLGKWLELAPVVINEETYQLTEYPAIDNDSRVIQSIVRTQPGHLESAYEDGVEDWVLSGNLHYINEYNT